MRENFTPEILTFESNLLSRPEDCSWFAVKTAVSNERCVADLLSLKGYEHFLPTYRTRKKWSDRNKEVSLPFFPGYVFCRLDPRYRLAALKTPGVQYLVGYGKAPVPIDECEIEAIRTVVSSGLPAIPCPFISLGEKARIIEGPLKGVEGFLERFKSGWRVVLSVTLLERSMFVEVDSAVLERVSPRDPREMMAVEL